MAELDRAISDRENLMNSMADNWESIVDVAEPQEQKMWEEEVIPGQGINVEAKEDGLLEEFKDVELREVQERKVIASKKNSLLILFEVNN